MVWYHLYTDITSPPFVSLRNSFFFKEIKKSELCNTKCITQLQLRCHPRKSRHKFVVQLKAYASCPSFLMATKACHTQMTRMTRPPREVMTTALRLSIE